jgi:hypothetical protein
LSLPSIDTIEAAIERAVEFIARAQQADGEVAARRHDTPDLSDAGELDPSNFATSFALYAMEFSAHPLAREVERRARALLMKEALGPGIWRYSAQRLTIPIDPDLDDTCCIAFAFRNWDEGRAFCRNNVESILRNRDRHSGLFRTWIRTHDCGNDTDFVVNANVLLYLGERPETMIARNTIVHAINCDEENRWYWYYCDMLAFYYAVARAHFYSVPGFAKCRDSVMRKIASRHEADAQPLTALTAAYSLCSLMYYGVQDETMIAADLAVILAEQSKDGGFPRYPFYTGWIPPFKCRHWWGSEALTAAFCIEALGLYVRWHCGRTDVRPEKQ